MGTRRARKRGRRQPRATRGRGCSPHRFRYKEQFGVIVICSGEREQERVYKQLIRKGHRCKVVVT